MKSKIARLLFAALIVAACQAQPGEILAGKIRAANSPLVKQVIYRPDNFIDPPEVDVWLHLGATDAEANELWCDVIEPAGGSHYEGDTGTVVWNATGTKMMAADAQC